MSTRWHTAPAMAKEEEYKPSAFDLLDEKTGNQQPFFRIMDDQVWPSLFPHLVLLLTRLQWPGAETALARLHLKQQHDQEYNLRSKKISMILHIGTWQNS